MKTFTELFRAACAATGLSIPQIAERTGAAQGTLEKWHCGQRTPRAWEQDGALRALAALSPRKKRAARL